MSLQTTCTVAADDASVHPAVMQIGLGFLKNHPAPMWLLDGHGLIVFQNAAASEELIIRSCVQRQGARLHVRGNHADSALLAYLRSLSRQGAGAKAVMDLRRDAHEPPLWLHFFVLHSSGDRVDNQALAVLVTLFDPCRTTVLNAHALTSLFHLTVAEARVASAVVEGMTAVQIGRATGTEVTTVRSHLRRIRIKLGARRTADAIRLLKQGEALWNSVAV